MNILEALAFAQTSIRRLHYDYGRLERENDRLRTENERLRLLIYNHRKATEGNILAEISKADKALYGVLDDSR